MVQSNTASAGFQATTIYATNTVTSQDGTIIGYRQYGQGSGIVLVQGAMGTVENFSHLAEALATTFTVFVPDRRGRGLSPCPYQSNHTIQRDVEDLEALLVQTGTHKVFALSSGAVIALTAAMSSTTIHQLAVFEPVLFTHHSMPVAAVARFEKAIAQDHVAAALIAAMKATRLAPFLDYVPNWLLTFFTNRALVSESKQPKGDGPTLRELGLSLQYDIRDITEAQGALQRFSGIQAEVLLLGGSKSPAYLRSDLDALEKVLPHVSRREFKGLGHAASWNYDKRRNPGGDPECVAQELRRLFH